MNSSASENPVQLEKPARRLIEGEAEWLLPRAASAASAAIPEPLCRWRFSEPAGSPRWSEGRHRHALRRRVEQLHQHAGGADDQDAQDGLAHDPTGVRAVNGVEH